MRTETERGYLMTNDEKIELAQNILEKNSKTALDTLKIMGFTIENGKLILSTDEEW